MQAGNDRLVQTDDGELRVVAAVVAFDVDAHAPVGSGILREPVHPPVVLEVVRTAAQGLVIVAAVDILPEAAAFIPALQLPFPGETLRLVVPVLEIKAREHVRPVGKGVFPLSAGHGVGRQPALSLVDKLIAQRPGGPVCRAVLPAGADRAALADVHAVLVLHVNEFLAHEVGRIAVLFPAGEDDVAQALGIAAFHAFLPGGKAQVFQRAPCGAGAGAPVRHGQDAVPDAGRVDARGIFCRVDFQAVARIEIQGAVLRDRQAVTGFDAADVPGRGRAVVACVLGAPGPVFGLGGFGRRAVGAVRRVCRAPGRPRGTVARSPGGGSRRVAGGLDVCHHLFRALFAGGRHDHRAGELFQQLLALGRGLVQRCFDDLGIETRARDKVDVLHKGHVAHNGQFPAHGQGRPLV